MHYQLKPFTFSRKKLVFSLLPPTELQVLCFVLGWVFYLADGLLKTAPPGEGKKKKKERLGFGRRDCQEKFNIPCVMGDQLTVSLR